MNLLWQAQDVLRAVRGATLHAQDWIARGVSIDSRTTKPNDLFVAIHGDSLDGHAYVHKAFEAGAVAAIVEHQLPLVPAEAPLIHVDDTFAALQDLGRVGRNRSRARIVAVTGSVGKTSAKEMLRLMLGAADDTYANEGSLNNHWGVPLSLARLPEEAKYGVFELGMNHAGELLALSRDVQPHVALITNVEAVHLEHFASVEAIADAKAEIFMGMNAAGLAVLNRDNPHYARLLAAARTQGLKKSLSFGFDPKSDAKIVNLALDEASSSVEALVLGEKISYRLNAPGRHLALGALGALLTCAVAEADLPLCAEALAGYRPPPGRGTRQTIATENGKSFLLIDETFNASPTAMQAAFAVLGQTPTAPEGRRVAVLGDMRELGNAGPEMHESLAIGLIKNRIDSVHCCGELMERLYNALPKPMRGHLTTDSGSLAPLVARDIQAGDVVMVKGSHSVHMEKIVEALREKADAFSQKNQRAG